VIVLAYAADVFSPVSKRVDQASEQAIERGLREQTMKRSGQGVNKQIEAEGRGWGEIFWSHHLPLLFSFCTRSKFCSRGVLLVIDVCNAD